jgi:thioredoxin-like negative regulator of GroEL
MEMLKELTQIRNQQELNAILKEKKNAIALFYASWCPYCLRFLPVFKNYTRGQEERFVLAQDDREEMSDTYEIDVFPTAIYFQNGQVVQRLDGTFGFGLDEREFADFLKGLDD